MLFSAALGNRENSGYAYLDALTRIGGGMNIATAERELIERMARFVKAELKRADVTYEQLADKLREMGHNESKISVANKVNRGTFSAAFFVAVMRAIGRENVNIAEL